MKLQGIVQYPVDAQSNSFFCALASALLPALGYAEDTPYFCAPKGRRCVSCGECGEKTALQKHHLALYHALLARLAFPIRKTIRWRSIVFQR